jgi:hypothetical protein
VGSSGNLVCGLDWPPARWVSLDMAAALNKKEKRETGSSYAASVKRDIYRPNVLGLSACSL